MVHTRLLLAAGIIPTYNPYKDQELFFLAMEKPETRVKVNLALAEITKPFLRFFHYGTNIGEAIEEVVGKKFVEIIPKFIPAFHKKTGKPIKPKKNEIYDDYYKTHKMSATNFDWLFYGTDGKIYRLEVKVIRAIESKEKEKNGEKFYQIQTPQWERALTFAEGSGGNGSFQQTKAEMFDFIMGVVIYADQVDYYVVPADDIKSGKLRIGNQHAGAIKEDKSTKEGHLGLKDLDSYKKLSVDSEEELLSKDSLNKYIT